MSAQFTVWTRDKNDEDSWVEQLTTDNLEEAGEAAIALGVGDTIASVWERGHFKIGSRRRTGNIMFWWSDNDNERMGGEPQGRGVGWPEHHDDNVTYEPAGSRAVATRNPSHEVEVAAPVRRYAMVHCDACGLEMPKNEAVPYTRDVKVGHSSGSYRTTTSSTYRSSSRSSSQSSTRSRSQSSGRTYYKRQTVLMCRSCYDGQLEADHKAFMWNLKFALIAFLVVGALWFGL